MKRRLSRTGTRAAGGGCPGAARRSSNAPTTTRIPSVRRLIADAADVDINRATFPNPFLKIIRMRVATALQILAAHDRRHLWQAEQVRMAPGFPAPVARAQP